MNLTETIKNNLNNMTKSESRVANFFLANQNDFALETLDDIAKKIEISTTSVIRFCRKMGFSGYKEFQEEVKSNLRYGLTLPDKLLALSRQNSFSGTIKSAVDCIEKTFRDIPSGCIESAANEIINAERVFCFGLKESFSLAHYAYTRFLTVRSNVFILYAGQNGEIETILSLKKGDVCIFFLFHRYTKQSPEILRLLYEQGVFVILVTSPPFDEIKHYSQILIPCHVDINGIKNSSVAPVCVVDHLCNTIVASSGEEVLNYMKKSEQLFNKFTFRNLEKD